MWGVTASGSRFNEDPSGYGPDPRRVWPGNGTGSWVGFPTGHITSPETVTLALTSAITKPDQGPGPACRGTLGDIRD